MSIAVIYCPPGVNRIRAGPCPKLVQVRPIRKRVKLATNCKKLRESFQRYIRFGPAIRRIRHFSSTYCAAGFSFLLTLKRLLGNYILQPGTFITSRFTRSQTGAYSKLKQTTAKQGYPAIGAEEQTFQSARRRTLSLGYGRTRLRFRVLKLRLRFGPVSLLKRLRDACVKKMKIDFSGKRHIPGSAMQSHSNWSFRADSPELHRS